MEAELLQKCVDDYEKAIDEQLSSANTVADLDTCNHKAKAKVLAALPEIWKEGSGPGIVSLKFVALVDKKLEESYAHKKEQFEARKIKNENVNSGSSIRVEALELYKKQMDKYLSKHAMASPKELLMKHQDVAQSVTNFIKEKFKDSIRSRTIIDLRMDMDGCHEYYQNRAKLNLSSLLDPALGIDLGTTNCCVMVYHKGEVQLIMNPVDGKRTTPSYVAFHPNDGTDTFGREAKESSYRNPELTIYDAKRMIGRSWSDENLQRDRKNWPFEIENDNDNPKIRTGNVSRYPHEVSARLLARFRNMAEEHFKLAPGTITKAVITVPAYFTEPQRRATEEAATCAGLQVLNILSEPSAAAIAYNYDKIRGNERKTVLIYDLGGGTFDVAIAEVRAHSVNVLGVDGDCHLGGQDFDQLIMEHCLKQFKTEHGLDIQTERDSSDRIIRNEARSALCRLKLQCELAKERLTTVKKTEVEVDKIFKGKDLSVVITRDLLEDLIKPLVAQTIDICKRAINEAIDKVEKTTLEIEEIILVGGATRMPLVEKMVTEYFPTNKICKSINPDEAVAYGAAVQAAIMNSAKDIKDIKIEDVIPLPIGVKTMTDTFTIVIPKNTKLPCEMKRVFATTSDNQMSTVVSVYQGEKPVCGENKWLGEFVFRGFLPRPAGEEKLQVTMTVNSNGILQVEAESVSTNRKNTITVKTERLEMDEKAIERVSNECAGLKLA